MRAFPRSRAIGRIVVSRVILITAFWLSGCAFLPAAEDTPAPTNTPTESIPDLDTNYNSEKFSLNAPAISLSSDGAPRRTVPPAPASPEIDTNQPASDSAMLKARENQCKQELETARYLRKTRQYKLADPMFVQLLGENVPELFKKSALLELAASAQDQNDLPRAQQTYAQFLNRWPDDPRIPELLLRLGVVCRQLGRHNWAVVKFSAVMTTALVVKNDRLDYFSKLVLQAQVEIADTHYDLGKFADAGQFYLRLYKQNNAALNRPELLYKLVRCNYNTEKYQEVINYSGEFLDHYPSATQQPEIRYYLAEALKQVGRNNDSLTQVLILLKEQSANAREHPEIWAHWQQVTGNLIANQLYREGDFNRALDIYINLGEIDKSPKWQFPVYYQIGMTYERLQQPDKATEIYNQLISRQSEYDTNTSPDLNNIVEMARWRIKYIGWQNHAESVNHELQSAATALNAKTSTPAQP